MKSNSKKLKGIKPFGAGIPINNLSEEEKAIKRARRMEAKKKLINSNI